MGGDCDVGGFAMTSVFLLIFLTVALSIVLGNRRITIRQFEWWAVYAIAACMFLVGRAL